MGLGGAAGKSPQKDAPNAPEGPGKQKMVGQAVQAIKGLIVVFKEQQGALQAGRVRGSQEMTQGSEIAPHQRSRSGPRLQGFETGNRQIQGTR